MSDDIPMAIYRAQQIGAIEAIERFTDALVDEGPENFLAIKHRMITELENKHVNPDPDNS